ncbi:bifunctional phosphoribosyl-AMP cyclohydrolase/phosphoribosyl-ATP diphosphatase HisIE [Nonlabens ulvanivorans]|uniref:bifunctional phosphoribosyl-AMP cyclohydrolase/phosphoribosyl-ATP diphosphatase HisIE n=1 Tax=Nonlabens ulvanivorans TaxID=906888 RepID=UPI00294350F2|nr:bifunctional phosphoribosyl-AMP cyclohydrolase/phosphoribosyl-ATP diphosphatase HisIE [Nonlabens ulvanivorans]WOI21768.1 bifunctional phosphoribosyl-AMP cyclohydrolase/phosphoribosyl-ATP diphosphatase HisIE [Nonlabens ulvanivorans]
MKLDWNKGENGLLPVIVQDATNKEVLMLGYMNEEAFEKTKAENRVTFYSRSKQRLWTKGESSQNYLDVVDIKIDCDQDTILIQANAHGATCHTGAVSCFDDFVSTSHESDGSSEILKQVQDDSLINFTIKDLEKTIHQRIDDKIESSYTYSLIQKGINKVAQKVGEEAVETVIDAINGTDEDFLYEAGDLMYHYLVLLKAKGYSLANIEKELAIRHSK